MQDPSEYHYGNGVRRGDDLRAVTATRYEFNNNFREEIENKGMQITGTSPTGELVETVEIPNHPFYIGVQFHPEFKSRPNRAHPLFKAFVAASLKRSQNNNAD